MPSEPIDVGRIPVRHRLRSFDWRQYVIYIGFAVVFVVFAVALGDKGFLTPNNLLNVFRQTALISIMAVGMTFVIGAGHIDLSVGATAGLASVTTALALGSLGLPGAIAVGLVTGFAVGLLNGALVAYVAIPSFLVTLGTLGIVNGTWLALLLANRILQSEQFSSAGFESFSVPWWQIAGMAALVFGASVLTTLIPSRQASSIPIAEALRYE